MIYLDNASTTKVLEECIRAVNIVMKEFWGNPSNTYDISDKPKEIISQAKRTIAQYFGCKPSEIFFTSGASEGNSWAMAQGDEILCSFYEHHNYLDNPKVIEIEDETFLEIYSKNNIYYPSTVYCHMLVNNITGEIFDVAKLFNVAHQNKMFTVCDVTQAVGNIGINFYDLDCDMAIMSGHKIGAPKGIGFVFIKEDKQDNIKPLIYGTQQNGLRGGTENVPYIYALEIAIEKACSNIRHKQEMCHLFKEAVIEKLKESGVDYYLNCGINNIESTINFSLANIESEALQAILSDKNIYIGTGSGCADGSMKLDNTLLAMKVPDKYIRGPIRLSFNSDTTLKKVKIAMDEIIKIYKELVGD